MTCCQIAAGCGIPVTGCTGETVPAGYVLVDLQATQMPLYVDVCGGKLYYWDGTKWVELGKDAKYLTYVPETRILTLMPDGSAVTLPLASSTIAGLVKIEAGGPITVAPDGTLVVDCAKLKANCGLLDTSTTPAGNVIYYNTVTNKLDVDCVALKAKCNLATTDQIPTIPNYNFAQQASLNGTVLTIANAQDPSGAVNVDLSSLAGGGGETDSGIRKTHWGAFGQPNLTANDPGFNGVDTAQASVTNYLPTNATVSFIGRHGILVSSGNWRPVDLGEPITSVGFAGISSITGTVTAIDAATGFSTIVFVLGPGQRMIWNGGVAQPATFGGSTMEVWHPTGVYITPYQGVLPQATETA